MNKNVGSELQERWEAYLRLYRAGATYSAFVRVSEIANWIQHASAPSSLVTEWTEILHKVEPTPNDLRSIGEEVAQKMEHIRRMVDSTTDLLYEEMLLIITIRTELDLLQRYLANRGAGQLAGVNSLDDALKAIAQGSRSSPVFRSAQMSARRNWGLPLTSKWLSSDTIQ